MKKPANCPPAQFAAFREWYDGLLRQSRLVREQAEDAFFSQWEDQADRAPTEHINRPVREDFGLKNELHRAVFVLKKSGGFSSESIARVLKRDRSTITRILHRVSNSI